LKSSVLWCMTKQDKNNIKISNFCNWLHHPAQFGEKNQLFLLNLGTLSPNLFLDFSQVPEIILNESSKNNENTLIECLRKETTRYFPKTKVYVVCLVVSLVFKSDCEILVLRVCLNSVKYEISENIQVRSQRIL
jgi:hypothetical protein